MNRHTELVMVYLMLSVLFGLSIANMATMMWLAFGIYVQDWLALVLFTIIGGVLSALARFLVRE